MRPSFGGRAIAAASLLAALAACGLFKSNEAVIATINKRVIGMPAGAFFDRYGRPQTRREKADGSMEYDWTSAVPYARAGPEGLDEHICRLLLTSDPRGRINSDVVRFDAPGLASTSRCGEIFAAG